jgi:hypothetical protein
LFFGPVFNREAAIAPRRLKIYIVRSVYVSAMLVLMCTAWLVLTGTQVVCDTGDLARFGATLFQILIPLQLALAAFFSSMLAASEVAHEKDRRTLILLLLTRLSNSELVLGKLMASLLSVLVMLFAAVPVFFLIALFGGVSFGQIARAMAVTLLTSLICGSVGSLLALWREKTFQALAMTVLVLVLWLALGELIASGLCGETLFGLPAHAIGVAISPWQAVLEAVRPYSPNLPELGFLGSPVYLFLIAAAIAAAAINVFAVAMVRVWNPSREFERGTAREEPETVAALEKQGGVAASRPDQASLSTAHCPPSTGCPSPLFRTRRVWDNPIIWREIRTWAYGRKILVIRLAYLLICALLVAGLSVEGATQVKNLWVWMLVPLALLSLVLINAQAVTSLTSERDAKALDLLLVTDLSAKEIVYGKLGGILYNTKEMVLLPFALSLWFWATGQLSFENFLYVAGALAVLIAFVAMLGVHAGMIYANSGVAVATSLGTVFFLFLGVATCMRIMMAFSGSFGAQFLPFFAFMVFGGVGLYTVLGVRNPSSAIGVASFTCPIATFYAITSGLTDPPSPLAMFLVTVAAYGFTVAAMLIPALCEFDVATGRSNADE